MSEPTTHQTALNEPDESTRLLPDAEPGGTTLASQARAPTPLPKTQLGALVAVRLVDPIAYSQIFPYINQLLSDFRIAAPEHVGFYSGFIESAYSLAQMFSVYQWGRLSDVVGRRPMLICGLICLTVSTIMFGWSTSLVGIIVSRFFGGLVAGNIAVFHSILVEITDDTNQNIAVPIYSLSWSTGTILGPLIGGTFANATKRYPKYFSWPVFMEHPYLPPCIITSVCALLGMIVGYFLIGETLPSKQKDAVNGVSTSSPCSASEVEPCSAEMGSVSVKALLAIPAMRALTLSGLALSFLSSAFQVVFTLFCYTPVDAGGLGLQPSTIGVFLAFSGTLAVLLRVVAMPYILHRFDYGTTYKTCMRLWPAMFAFLPLFNVLARTHPPPYSNIGPEPGATTTAEIVIWIGLALVLALSKVAAIPYSITVLLVKRHAPIQSQSPSASIDNSGFRSISASATARGSGSALGQSNGLVQFVMCLGHAVGPVVVSTLFSVLNGSVWATRWGIGWMWSIVMVSFAVVGVRVTNGLR